MSLPEPDKSGVIVSEMFGDIARTYDLLNHLLSANQDIIWRKRAVTRFCPRRGEFILDLCCGTGDLTREIVRQSPQSNVIGADFALPMLEIAREKYPDLRFEQADALNLPFEDATFDALSAGFGVRNFENTRAGLQEMMRVLKPGGRLLVLEFMRPTSSALMRFFNGFNAALAPVGRKISGHATAYNYLPQSVEGFYTRRDFESLLRAEKFENVRSFQHSFGIATSFLAQKSA